MSTEMLISPRKTDDERVVFRVEESFNASLFLRVWR